MFPLGTVLVPGMLLPLHVFEPRYRRLVEDCRAGDRRFGVVLIERGSEVGGGDVRTDIGTLAQIVQADELPDGRWVVGAVGMYRIRVERWLDDDPYPRAEVARWPDRPEDIDEPHRPDEPVGTGALASDSQAADPSPASDDRELVTVMLRRAAALRREMGEPAPGLDLELADNPVVASYQAVGAAPLGPADRQALLAAPTLPERWALMRRLLDEEIQVLQARLAGG